MSIQGPFVASSDIADRAVLFLSCNVKLLFGGDFWLGSSGSCKAIGGIFRCVGCTELAVIRSPDRPTSLIGHNSHVFKLFRGEVEVVHAFDDTFGERIVTAQTRPAKGIACPGTIGKAVLGRTLKHGPEDEVKCSLNGDKGGSKDWNSCCVGRIAPGE